MPIPLNVLWHITSYFHCIIGSDLCDADGYSKKKWSRCCPTKIAPRPSLIQYECPHYNPTVLYRTTYSHFFSSNSWFIFLLMWETALSFRLKEVADKIGKHGFTSPPALHALRNIPIQQVVVGPSHIAFLLQVSYNINPYPRNAARVAHGRMS